MANALQLYFDALERLRKDAPLVLPKGTKISNDSVSLEAGRGKGSIKKSRPAFAELISAINELSENQSSSVDRVKRRFQQLEFDCTKYRELYELQLAERGAILLEVQQLRETIMMLETSYNMQRQELETSKDLAARLQAELSKLKGGPLYAVPG